MNNGSGLINDASSSLNTLIQLLGLQGSYPITLQANQTDYMEKSGVFVEASQKRIKRH